jgi:hypothetical protein
VCLGIINILFIIDIELTLRRNKGNQTDGDDTWGFGQVLALVLLLVPIRDACNGVQLEELLEYLQGIQGIQNRFEKLLEKEVKATRVASELERLMDAGAGLCAPRDAKFADYLQLFAYHGRLDLVQYFQEYVNDNVCRKFSASSYIHSVDKL